MYKIINKILIVIIIFFITSCISNYEIQKNHSNGGLISYHGKHKKKYTKSNLAN